MAKVNELNGQSIYYIYYLFLLYLTKSTTTDGDMAASITIEPKFFPLKNISSTYSTIQSIQQCSSSYWIQLHHSTTAYLPVILSLSHSSCDHLALVHSPLSYFHFHIPLSSFLLLPARGKGGGLAFFHFYSSTKSFAHIFNYFKAHPLPSTSTMYLSIF